MGISSFARAAAKRVVNGPAPVAGFFGDLDSWEAAKRAASPYRTNIPRLAKLSEDMRSGGEPSGTFSALAVGLLLAEGELRVLDFGGSLGHMYFRSVRSFGEHIRSWHVVELPDAVAAGRERFEDERLRFFTDLEAATESKPNVVLCGGVLQYLDDPYSTIHRMTALRPDVIVFDRTPLYPERERFMIQKTWPHLGGDVLPVRILSAARAAPAGYSIFLEHYIDGCAPDATDARYVAQLWRRI
jgi:putative methyltransferase (TIGR04325 family)